MPNPVDPIKQLGHKMATLAESLGAEMQQFTLDLDLEGDADLIRAVFILSNEERPEVDIQEFLDDIEAHVREAAPEET